MKFWITIFITILLFTSIASKKKKKQQEKVEQKPKKITYRYINNWDLYMLPKVVPVIALRDILHKVALYTRLKYCPFGENKCDPAKIGMSEIVHQINDDAMTAFKNDHPDEQIPEEPTPQEIAPVIPNKVENVNLNLPNEINSEIMNVHELVLRKGYLAIPFSKILQEHYDEDDIDTLDSAEDMDSIKLHEVKPSFQKLYGPKYENFKIDPKLRRPIRKLPFDPYLVHDG